MTDQTHCLLAVPRQQPWSPLVGLLQKGYQPGALYGNRLQSVERNFILFSAASFISFSGTGLGCEAISRRRADRRCCLAASTGPNTFFLSRWLLAFVTLDRWDLAIFTSLRA